MKTKIFESNPNLKEVHITSDGECFYNDNDAKLHAKTLEDKGVELVLNPKFVNDIEVKDAEDLKSSFYDAPALDDMTKAQLVDFAKLNFNVELNAKASKPELLKSIDELLKKEATAEGAPVEGAPVEGAPVEGAPVEGASDESKKEETNTQE